MKKDEHIFVHHILNSIKNIEEDTNNFTKEEFFRARTIQDAVIRNIEIIGEACKNLPSEYKKKHKNIPWNDIIGMRDKLIHGYFGVDLKIVWNVVTTELPKLKQQLKEIIKEENVK